MNHIQNYKQRTSNYLAFVQGLADNANTELKANKNTRPSTEYSIHDIAFTFVKFLPSWVYPESLWKEDLVTRRRHIAKVLRSSPLISRPRYVNIRDNVVEWTKRSGHTLAQDHFGNITYDLDSLLVSTMDFVSTATDAELMDSLFMTAGYVTLDHAIEQYIKDSDDLFDATLNQINEDFNHIVGLSGELRVPLESMRLHAIQKTVYIRNEMFKLGVADRLRHLGHHIKAELQKLSQEIKDIHDNQEASLALRKHTADSLRLEIQDIESVYALLKRSKSFVERVWDNTRSELVQSPIKINYWVDVVAEVKEAVMELLRLLLKSKKRHHQKHHHCSCYH